MSGQSGANDEFIRRRQKIVKSLLKEGLTCSDIVKRLKTMKAGKYAASKDTVRRDKDEIKIKRANWDKIHIPHKMEVAEQQREQLIGELDCLISAAQERGQYKTAGDLIAKKARLLGVDKFIAPKAKKKDGIEEKYRNKSQDEINEVLFQEFKELAASILRLIKRGQFGNIVKMTIRICRKEKDSNLKKYIITRFGDEKNTYRIQDELTNHGKQIDKKEEVKDLKTDDDNTNKDLLNI